MRGLDEAACVWIVAHANAADLRGRLEELQLEPWKLVRNSWSKHPHLTFETLRSTLYFKILTPAGRVAADIVDFFFLQSLRRQCARQE
jgi:hypothetical protein